MRQSTRGRPRTSAARPLIEVTALTNQTTGIGNALSGRRFLVAEGIPQDSRLVARLDQRLAGIALARLELAQIFATIEPTEIGMGPSHDSAPSTAAARTRLCRATIAVRLLDVAYAIFSVVVTAPVGRRDSVTGSAARS